MNRCECAMRAVCEFHYPDGEVAARARSQYKGDNLVSHELEGLQIKAPGAVKLPRALITPVSRVISSDCVASTAFSGETNADMASLRRDTLAGGMIAPLLAAHLNDLTEGKDVKCQVIVPARTGTVGFTFAKRAESTWRRKPSTIIKLSPSGFGAKHTQGTFGAVRASLQSADCPNSQRPGRLGIES